MSDLQDKKYGFIGGGKVGFSLANYIRSNNLEVSYIYSPNLIQNRKRCREYNFCASDNLFKTISESDVIFITTPDSEIISIAKRINSYNLSNKIIIHCSGAITSKNISTKANTKILGIHPIAAVSNFNYPLNEIVFTLESIDEELILFGIDFVKILGNDYKILVGAYKEQYHLGLVFSSNMISAILKLGIEHLKKCDLGNEEEILSLLKPLVFSNLNSNFKKGIKDSITGPAIRNDTNTIEIHKKVIDNPYEKEVYNNLTKIIQGMRNE